MLRDKKEFDVNLPREVVSGKIDNSATASKTIPEIRTPAEQIEREVVKIGGEHYLVIKPHSAQLSHELSLRAGEIVCVQRKHEKGWWEGSVQGDSSRKGWFPSKIVQPIEHNSAAAAGAPPSGHARAPDAPPSSSSADDDEYDAMLDQPDSASPFMSASPRDEDGREEGHLLAGSEEWDVEEGWRGREARRLARQAAALLGEIRSALPPVSPRRRRPPRAAHSPPLPRPRPARG